MSRSSETDRTSTPHLQVAIIAPEQSQRLGVILIGAIGIVAIWVLIAYGLHQAFRWFSIGVTPSGNSNADIYAIALSSISVVVVPILWIVWQRSRSWAGSRKRLLVSLARDHPRGVPREEAARSLIALWRHRIYGDPAMLGVSNTSLEDILAVEHAFQIALPRVYIGADITPQSLAKGAASWKGTVPASQPVHTFSSGFKAFSSSLLIGAACAFAVYSLFPQRSGSASSSLISAPTVAGVLFAVSAGIIQWGIRKQTASSIRVQMDCVIVQHERLFGKRPLSIELTPHQCVVLIRHCRERHGRSLLWEFRPAAGSTPFFSKSFDPRTSPWEAPLRDLLAQRFGIR